MMNILEEICKNKREEINLQKEAVSLAYLKNLISLKSREKVSFKQALVNSDTGIIAEFKRRSPSKGWIHEKAEIESIVSGYELAGASAISCLTDEKFFGGSFHDFRKVRNIVKEIPLLRKDFIIDEYQIYQSKVMGVDVILLIAACLTPDESFRYTNIAHDLGMEVLLEIHNEKELEYLQTNVDVVGINNRDLKTFITDIQQTIKLSKQIPDNYIKISESGISSAQTVKELKKEGFSGFLMGENFMKNEDPAKALRNFIEEIETD